jgi:hypothetical protein
MDFATRSIVIWSAPSLPEKLAILGIGLQAVHNAVEGMGHFDGIGDGTFGLLFKRRGAAIPELQRTVGGVDDCRGMACASLAADTDGDPTRIGERELGRMAGGTGDGAVHGKLRIAVETAAERDGVIRGRIVGRHRHCGKA